LEKAE